MPPDLCCFLQSQSEDVEGPRVTRVFSLLRRKASPLAVPTEDYHPQNHLGCNADMGFTNPPINQAQLKPC